MVHAPRLDLLADSRPQDPTCFYRAFLHAKLCYRLPKLTRAVLFKGHAQLRGDQIMDAAMLEAGDERYA